MRSAGRTDPGAHKGFMHHADDAPPSRNTRPGAHGVAGFASARPAGARYRSNNDGMLVEIFVRAGSRIRTARWTGKD